MSLPADWIKAYVTSDGRWKDWALQHGLTDLCRRDDGTLCPFSRGIRMGNIIYIACILSKCVKRYPTIDDIQESGNK